MQMNIVIIDSIRASDNLNNNFEISTGISLKNSLFTSKIPLEIHFKGKYNKHHIY